MGIIGGLLLIVNSGVAEEAHMKINQTIPPVVKNNYDEVWLLYLKYPSGTQQALFNKEGSINTGIIQASRKLSDKHFKMLGNILKDETSYEDHSMEIILLLYVFIFFENKKPVFILAPNLLGGDLGELPSSKKYYSWSNKGVDRICSLSRLILAEINSKDINILNFKIDRKWLKEENLENMEGKPL